MENDEAEIDSNFRKIRGLESKSCREEHSLELSRCSKYHTKVSKIIYMRSSWRISDAVYLNVIYYMIRLSKVQLSHPLEYRNSSRVATFKRETHIQHGPHAVTFHILKSQPILNSTFNKKQELAPRLRFYAVRPLVSLDPRRPNAVLCPQTSLNRQ